MLNWANGYKTIAGIVAGVATFLLVVINALNDGFQQADFQVILGGVSALLVTIGLASKAERILSFLKK